MNDSSCANHLLLYISSACVASSFFFAPSLLQNSHCPAILRSCVDFFSVKKKTWLLFFDTRCPLAIAHSTIPMRAHFIFQAYSWTKIRYSISYPFIQILLPWHNKSRPSHPASSRLSFPLYFARINSRIFIIFFVFLLSHFWSVVFYVNFTTFVVGQNAGERWRRRRAKSGRNTICRLLCGLPFNLSGWICLSQSREKKILPNAHINTEDRKSVV